MLYVVQGVRVTDMFARHKLMLWKQSTRSYGLSSQGLPQFTRLYLKNLLWRNQFNFHDWNDESLMSSCYSSWDLTCPSLMPITERVFFVVVSLQFMRHQRQHLPAWMRLTMAVFGFLFPREALFPRLRGEQRWRDFLLVLASALVPPLPPRKGQGTRL